MKKFFKKIENRFLVKDKTKGGFTLIELMVATSIFMIIMLVAMGSIVISSNASKRAQKLRYAMDNVNFALESMTRSIRMGTDYEERDNGNGISFNLADENGENIKRIYYFMGEKDGKSSLYRKIDSSDPVEIVASEVDVEKLNFDVKGELVGDNLSPSVYILMKGTVKIKGEEDTSFAIQTMASQRNLEEVNSIVENNNEEENG